MTNIGRARRSTKYSRAAANRPDPDRRQPVGPGGYLRRAGGLSRRSRPAPTRISCSAPGTTARPTARHYARSARLGRRHRQVVPQNVMIPFLDQYLKGGPPAEHRQGHRVRGRNQPVAAPRRLAAGLHPRLPGEPDPALSRARLAGSASTPRRRGADSYVSDPAKPVTYRARPNLSPMPGLDLAHLAGRRPALRRGPPRRPRLIRARPAQPLQARRHPARPPRRLDQRHRQRLGGQADRRLSRQYPQKPELGGYQLAIAMDVLRGRYRDDPAQPRAVPAEPAGHLRIRAAHGRLCRPARPPADGPGPVELVPALRPQPADLRPQHLLRQAAGLSRRDAEGVHRPGGSWIGLPVIQ